MDPIAPSGINRRVMLSTLAVLPVLPGLLRPIPAAAQAPAAGGPLPSWNDGAAKQAILDFVRATTDQASPSYVRPEERIATFDQDGTLWVEHPMYSQVVYCLDRVPAVVAKRPELRNAEPFKTVLSGNRAGDGETLDAGSRKDSRRDADRHDGGGIQRRGHEAGSKRPGIRAGSVPTPSWSISRCSKFCAICATTATRPTS